MTTMNEGLFIFLAEDDVDDQELLTEAFLNIDDSISFRTATNGMKAINYLEALQPKEQPCLIVLDYNLPELSGAEILQRIKSMDRYDNVSKVVWSTSSSPLYQKICLDLGAKAYFVKPNDVAGIRNLAQLMLQMCTVK